MGIFATIRKIFRPPHKPWDGPVIFDDMQFRVGPPNPCELAWSAIEKITAYKSDLLTVDEIRVQFDCAGGSAVVTEESPGFHEFMQEVVRRFPPAADWYAKVSQPAFSACETTLYVKLRT